MIITKQKRFNDLLESIDSKPVFLIGCSECATLCHTGGKEELVALRDALLKNNVPVTGWVVLEPACHLMNDKRLLKKYENELQNSSKILILTCGNGVQTVAEIVSGKEVIAGTDTLFLGEISRANEFDKRCTLCGECLLDTFGGFCPVARCPKSMLNGPCGGSTNGKCEVNSEMECIWDLIYQNLKKQGTLKTLSVIQKPKDWSKELEMKRRI
ncbi:MAG: methylenetetrahydrofolate reductase C-terminal domain-containing protein [Candidatus Thermoplasmatota archaeon]|nr:methylenetetrahydrofolate reductase C-terminal domain-containing protein [Candidatus Thermoplasmatota archaeon]